MRITHYEPARCSLRGFDTMLRAHIASVDDNSTFETCAFCTSKECPLRQLLEQSVRSSIGSTTRKGCYRVLTVLLRYIKTRGPTQDQDQIASSAPFHLSRKPRSNRMNTPFAGGRTATVRSK